MVVKSVRGRRRYVVYTVPADVGREAVLGVLTGPDGIPGDIKVITSFDGKAVVRCPPELREAVHARMTESFPGSESLITSGTLRTVRDAYPELRVPQKKKR